MHKPVTSIDYLVNVVRNLFQIILHLSVETYTDLRKHSEAHRKQSEAGRKTCPVATPTQKSIKGARQSSFLS